MLRGQCKLFSDSTHYFPICTLSSLFRGAQDTKVINLLCRRRSGYLAPEYAMRGHLTEKTDVFAFGVVALEIVSGRLNFDPNVEEEKAYLLEWV